MLYLDILINWSSCPGLIGENPFGIPNNCVYPQVALGSLDRLKIYGNDYETTDGTGVRLYSRC